MLFVVRAFDVEPTMSVEYERLINRTAPTIVLYARTSPLHPETDMLSAPHSIRNAPRLTRCCVGTWKEVKQQQDQYCT